MKKCLALTMILCAVCSAVASCQTAKVTDPCDVLVSMNPQPATNQFLIANDRQFAVAVAQHRGRFSHFKCGAK